MKTKQLAEKIITHVGGEENINSVIHCTTRLRFQLKDKGKANKEALEKLDGVITVVQSGGQYQVVVGNTVPEVYNAIIDQTKLKDASLSKDESEKEGNLLSRGIEMISSIFSPLLGILAGAGLLKGLLSMTTTFKWLDPASGSYRILYAASDSFFYFMPFFLAYTAARRFKTSPFIAMALAGALVYPDITGIQASGDSITFFGIPVVLMKYSSSVIPIILSVWVLSYLEKNVKKLLHESVRNLITTIVCLVIMVPLAYLLIGPLGTYVGSGIAAGITWTYNLNPIIAGFVVGAIFQVLVIFGIHWGLVPIMLNNITTHGRDVITPLYGPSAIAQAGASLGVFLKTKNKKLKTISFSAFITGLFGVTEPAIYGVTLKLKKPFIIACLSGGIGGAIAGGYHSSAVALVPKSILTFPAFFGPGFIGYLIGFIVAFVLSVVLTYIVGFEDPVEEIEEPLDKKEAAPTREPSPFQKEELASPLAGVIVPLDKVDDQVFSSLAMGKGVAVEPSEDKLYSPVDGTVTVVSSTKHAYGIMTKKGAEILIHIGMDTVNLQGKYFTPSVKEGDEVKAGDLLAEFDAEKIKAEGYSLITPIVITNTASFLDVLVTKENDVVKGEPILTVVG